MVKKATTQSAVHIQEIEKQTAGYCIWLCV